MPYMKPNNSPLYVNKNSNHPPNILKNIPESVNKRLSSISANKTVFEKAAPPYQKALKNSGYDYKMKFENKNDGNKKSDQKKPRRKKATWFNPPYSNNVKTNVGKQFLDLVDKCFPEDNKLHKLINRKTVKISYSCMNNMKQEISNHNKTVLKPQTSPTQRDCNCPKKKKCPLDRKCLTKGVIYQATVTRKDNNKEETYIGLTENQFKTRFNNHTNTFRDKEKRSSTTLSHYIWTLKDKNVDFELQWKLIDRATPYTPESNVCRLCIKEKYYILCQPQLCTLNSRTEMCTECRHRKKYLLCNAK